MPWVVYLKGVWIKLAEKTSLTYLHIKRSTLLQKSATECPKGTYKMIFRNAEENIESFRSNFRVKNVGTLK